MVFVCSVRVQRGEASERGRQFTMANKTRVWIGKKGRRDKMEETKKSWTVFNPASPLPYLVQTRCGIAEPRAVRKQETCQHYL
jgi:hypothetical protein